MADASVLYLLPALHRIHVDCLAQRCAKAQKANGPSLLAFLLCVVWAGDTAALYVGRALGRHKMAPTLSPNKTWEGALARWPAACSQPASCSAWPICLRRSGNKAWLSYPESVWYWLTLAVVVNVAAQVGDLAESALSARPESRTPAPSCRPWRRA